MFHLYMQIVFIIELVLALLLLYVYFSFTLELPLMIWQATHLITIILFTNYEMAFKVKQAGEMLPPTTNNHLLFLGL